MITSLLHLLRAWSRRAAASPGTPGARRLSRRQEAGYVTVLISIMVPALFIGLAATAVDTARWYLEAERVQKAADAAALAGVPYLPHDFASARTLALQVAKRNGYDDARPDVVVVVAQGARDSQLRVTITSTIRNQFGQLINVDNATITRAAVADFTGPAPMGSPCNVFGTEPPSGSGTGSPTPRGTSAIGATRPANCPQDPMMWASVAGPQAGKVQGDRYGTTGCENANVDYCDGSRKNEEYPETPPRDEIDGRGERGYIWSVKVQPRMVGRPISLQLYDPAFVNTGQECKELPAQSTFSDKMNQFVTTDGRVRYGAPPDSYSGIPYCTGDSYAGNAPKNHMTTTFIVREQTDTQDPMQAPVISSCAKQYGSFLKAPTNDDLLGPTGPAAPAPDAPWWVWLQYWASGGGGTGSASYDAELASVYHNWTELCTFTPTRSGDYYLQVRTNKKPLSNEGGQDLVHDVPSGSVQQLATKEGDDGVQGGGSNSFGIRAVTPTGYERDVAVSGWSRMPIYANSPNAETIFPLVRVLPGAAGQTISFQFYDAADVTGSGSGTVRVYPPADATGTVTSNPFPGRCRTRFPESTSTWSTVNNSTCSVTVSSAQNNGRVQELSIPIPTDYTCDATVFTNCWYRVMISFPGNKVHDVTTWNAFIDGDPVRLIE